MIDPEDLHMKCPNCGNELPKGARFCTRCGSKTAPAENSYSKTSSGSKKWLIIIIIAAAAAAVIIAAVLLTRKSPAQQAEESLKSQLAANGETLDTEDTGTRIAELIYRNAKWEVKSAKNGTAVISVSAPDFYALFKSLANDTAPADADEYDAFISDLESSLEKALSRGNYSRMEKEVSVPIASDGSVTMTFDLADALYGGLLSLSNELETDYMGGGSR